MQPIRLIYEMIDEGAQSNLEERECDRYDENIKTTEKENNCSDDGMYHYDF